MGCAGALLSMVFGYHAAKLVAYHADPFTRLIRWSVQGIVCVSFFLPQQFPQANFDYL